MTGVRVTLTLDSDVAVQLEALSRRTGLPLDQLVNERLRVLPLQPPELSRGRLAPASNCETPKAELRALDRRDARVRVGLAL